MSDSSSPLFEFLLRQGDSALVLGHRTSEWCGLAPVIEEDIALANIALDLIGQAKLWLEYASEEEGAGRSANDLAFLRDAYDFRNLLMLELPNKDNNNETCAWTPNNVFFVNGCCGIIVE